MLKGVGRFDGWTEGGLMGFPTHDSEAQWGPVEAVSPTHFSGQAGNRVGEVAVFSGRCGGSAAREAVDPAPVQLPSGKMFYHVSRARGGGEGRVRGGAGGRPGLGSGFLPHTPPAPCPTPFQFPPDFPGARILLHPRYFGLTCSTVKQKLFTEVEGTCTGK